MGFSGKHDKNTIDTILAELKNDFRVILIKRRPLLGKFLLATAILSFIALLGGGYYMCFSAAGLNDSSGKPLDFEKINKENITRTSFVYSADGKIIGRFFYAARDPVKYGEVPSLLINGFVAAEDKRFFRHQGIDVIAISRALITNAFYKLGYGKRIGASTITQQLARLLYAEELPEFRNREQSYWRKVKEARVAIQLDRRYSKEKILEEFLNRIYFGHGTNGISEAGRYYFGKDVRKNSLSLQEIAILVSLNKSSSIYSPIFNPPPKPIPLPETSREDQELVEQDYQKARTREVARMTLVRKRYNWVLEKMLVCGYIGKEQYAVSLFAEEEPFDQSALRITPLKNGEFGYGNRMVKEMLLTAGFEDSDITHYGGLSVKTTFDSGIQKIVSEELNTRLAEINQELDGEKLEGAAVVIENDTGCILALSGGHDFNETNFNRALALRSPGSGFKPIVYAAAFELAGKSFDDTICNCPFTMPARVNFDGTVLTWWSPRNFKERNPVPYGQILLPIGLIRSVNLATLNLAKEIGIKRIIEIAHRLGIWGNRGIQRDSGNNVWFQTPGLVPKAGYGLQPYLPTAIGGSDVSLIELANAFSVFARRGVYLRPTIIDEVRNCDGKLLFSAPKPKKERAISEEAADKTTALLRAVTKVGTARGAFAKVRQPVAAKTGTSNGPKDLLLICFTPDITVGVRLGYDSSRIIEIPEYMKKVSGSRDLQVSGGWVAGPLAAKIIARIYENRPLSEFPYETEERLNALLLKQYGIGKKN